MKSFKFTPTEENITPKVVSALSELKNGGEIKFEKGTYHFYPEGTIQKYFAPTNNGNGIKSIAFPILGMKDIVIDGGDSTFIFHKNTFPFIISESKNITIKNFTSTMDSPPYILMKIGKKLDDGFTMTMHPETHYIVDEEGHLFFTDENGKIIIDTKNGVLSLHSMDRICITYCATGPTTANKAILATNHHETVASDIGNRTVFFKYMPSDDPRAIKCRFYEGENIGIIVGGRSRDVVFLADSEEISISDVTVKRGLGMGIIGQCCHNVNVLRFKAIPNEGEPASLTADAMHFVNCTGLIDIRGCVVSKSMDDFLNVHGMYARVGEVLKNGIKVKICHYEQTGFLPYKVGDKLDIIDPETLDIKCRVTAGSYHFTNDNADEAILEIKDPETLKSVSVGDLIEDSDRMSDLNFVGNKGFDIPRVLMAGGKHYYYAENELRGFTCSLSAEDVPNYWHESGRLGELIMENNIIDGKGKLGDAPAIRIGVSGFAQGNAPKVHGKVIIRNNKLYNIKNLICHDGIKELILENNIIEI